MNWFEFIKEIPILTVIRIGLLALCIPVLFAITRFMAVFIKKRSSKHMAQLISNLLFYAGFVLLSMMLLNEFGFNVSALLGAAGLVGIAVGFAAQTSVANVISGIFLLFEHPFVVGDIIICEGQKGIVESIDLLSIKLRTANGNLVRIANEDLIKKVVVNQSYFPKQFISFTFQSPPDIEVQRVLDFIQESINEVAIILKEPAPLITITDYSQYSNDYVARVWIKTADRAQVYERLLTKIKQKGKEHNLYLGIKRNY